MQEIVTAKFGDEMRKQEFRMRDGAGYLNHGSYGMVPRRVQKEHRRLLDNMEEHPDDHFRRTLFPKYKESLVVIAKFINSDVDDVVFVQNATTDVKCLSVPIEYPIKSEDDIVKRYETFLQSHPEIKLVVIDYITSPTATLMPVKKIIDVCRKYGAMTLIDAAHAPGQVQLDMKDLDPDFLTGNMHKWVYNPRGCAFLYVKRCHQNMIVPVVTSWGYQEGFLLDFFNQATRDDTPYLCVPESVKFYNDIGGMEAITKYTSDMLEQAIQMMMSAWGTEKLGMPKSMEAPYMRLVRLPQLEGYEKTQAVSEQMMADFYYSDNIQTAIMCINGEHYVRLSANVYNVIEEYQKFCNVISRVEKVPLDRSELPDGFVMYSQNRK